MQITTNLKNLDNLKTGCLVLFIPENPWPLQGLASLIDWRLCFLFSKWLLENKLPLDTINPSILVNFERLSFGPIFLFPCNESLSNKIEYDRRIFSMLKILNNVGINDFAISFPDKYLWMYEYWKYNYEPNQIFNHIPVFEPSSYSQSKY